MSDTSLACAQQVSRALPRLVGQLLIEYIRSGNAMPVLALSKNATLGGDEDNPPQSPDCWGPSPTRHSAFQFGPTRSYDNGDQFPPSPTSVSVREGSGPLSSKSRRLSGTATDAFKMRQSIRETIEFEKFEKLEEERRLSLKLPSYNRVSKCIVQNTVFSTMTTMLTMYALMGDDFRLATTHMPADFIFDVFTVACIVIFTVEIFLSCLGKPDYTNGFFFWLDLIATITLFVDITVVSDFLFQSGDESMSDMKNSRTARIGARAARVVRVLRLVRILKLYKAIYEARQKAARNQRQENLDDWEEEDDDMHVDMDLSESNVGKKLSDLTTRRCVILILAMMLVYPLLEPPSTDLPDAYSYGAVTVEQDFQAMEQDSTQRWRYQESVLTNIYWSNWYTKQQSPECDGFPGDCPSIYALHVFWVGISGNNEAVCKDKASKCELNASAVIDWDRGIRASDPDVFYSMGGMPASVVSILSSPWNKECRSSSGTYRVGISLLGKLTPAAEDYAVECPEDLRKVESKFIFSSVLSEGRKSEWHFVFFYDNRPIVREEAFMNMWTTVFICVLLCVASMMFSRDAHELVLKPVETMMLKVQMIRINPLIAAKLTDDAFKREEIMKAKSVKLQKDIWRMRLRAMQNLVCCTAREHSLQRPMETAILEKTIIKLGTLLAIGFGTAGMNIISQNMQGLDSAGVDAMIEGTTVECVIGYTRMGDFGTFTEVLQSRVMTFVNQVAEIIHGAVDAFHGAPSRNSGDTFLAVWVTEEPAMVSKLADLAVMASAIVVGGVNRSATLAAYRTHPGLQQRFCGTDCRVSVTFGLHFGWAIEGALGTEYKIDPTYVSPNVSIAETVEQAAEIYGTSILLTEATQKTLSPDMASKCRIIDRVKVRGSPAPMDLYTVDLNSTILPIDKPQELRWNTRQRFRARQILDSEKLERLSCTYSVSAAFDAHPDIASMRKAYTVEFREVFGMGFQNYAQGEWKSAQKLLVRAMGVLLSTSHVEDGPSAALLRYMQNHGCNAPSDWRGVHPLEDMPARTVRNGTVSGMGVFGRPVTKALCSSKIEQAMQEIAIEEPAMLGVRLR